MLDDSLGCIGLLSVALWVYFCAYRWPLAAKFIWASFIVRAGASLFHFYVAPLPDGGQDARHFDNVAWEWAEMGPGAMLDNFTGFSSFSISWVLSILYGFTDRSLLLAQSLSVFMGTTSVLLGWLLIRELWGQRVAASKVGWVLAFFPTLVLYSALTMREPYVCFFLLIAMTGVVHWIKYDGARFLIMSVFGFVGAAFFHGAMIIGLIVFVFFVSSRSIKKFIRGLSRKRVNTSSFVVVVFALGFLTSFSLGFVSVPKLGNVYEITNFDRTISIINSRTRSSGDLASGAAYPEWTRANGLIDLIYKSPLRVGYFLFSPFPWELKHSGHLVGLIDSFLYIFFIILIWRNRKSIYASPAAKILLLILISYIVVFSFGTGNFGTGIRHRSKLVICLIILSAPFFPRFTIRKKCRNSPKV